MSAAGVEGLQAFLVVRDGQSVGKKLVGIRIVKLDGSSVRFVDGVALRTLLPWAVGYIPYVGVWLMAIDILFIFRKNHRCLHDLLAGTRVVKVATSR